MEVNLWFCIQRSDLAFQVPNSLPDIIYLHTRHKNCTLTSWLPLVTSSWLPPHRCGAFLLRVSSSGRTLLDSCLPMDAAAGVCVWVCRCEEGIAVRRRRGPVCSLPLSLCYQGSQRQCRHHDLGEAMEKEAYDHATKALILYTCSSVFFCTQLSILLYTAQYSYVLLQYSSVHSSVFLCINFSILLCYFSIVTTCTPVLSQ